MKTAIVIPSFNRRSTTLRCLETLIPVLPPDHVVIVSDSGSSDGTEFAIRTKFPMVVLVPGNPSQWWSGAVNRGIDQALVLGCSRIITYNDDNVATPGILCALRDAAELNRDAIIAAVVCYADAADKVFFSGRRRGRFSDRFYYVGLNGRRDQLEGGLREVDLLHGMCTLFPRSVFENVGLFDDHAFPHLFADDDLVLRAHKSGYGVLVALDAVVLNDRTQTGLNPYDRRLGVGDIWRLFTSRKSVFQVGTRVRFFWRHRRSVPRFLFTMVTDYVRVCVVIAARWLLPGKFFVAIAHRVARRV